MIKVVICGSYHRDSESLALIFKELESHSCRILSPISIKFNNNDEPVVKSSTEKDISIKELETFHLRTIKDADFIWLHSPMGYVGTSASYELGFANALGVPVFCYEFPHDEMLQTRTIKVNSVFQALEQLSGSLLP